MWDRKSTVFLYYSLILKDMVVLKHIPEDFVVNEVPLLTSQSSGDYSLFLLKKRCMNTIDALSVLSERWHIPLRFFGFAGNKDKNALTTQLCSVQGIAVNCELKFGDHEPSSGSWSQVAVSVVGRSSRPVSLGFLNGNNFEIVVRDVDSVPVVREKFVNFFGEQRFSKVNADVGLCIIKGDFRGVCDLLKDSYPVVVESLEKSPNDVLGAIKRLPLKTLRLFVHAYQSRVWNDCVKTLVEEKTEIEIFPIVGFATDMSEFSMISKRLEKDGVTPRHFVIRSFPELSSEGGTRNVWCLAENLTVKVEGDDLFKGKKKVLLKFFLSKGCYATEFVRQMFG